MDIKRAKIKIKPGLIVRDPIKKAIHKGEVTVTLTSFWRRRIKCGDAELVKEVVVKAETKPEAKGESKKVEAPKKEFNKKSNKEKSGGN